MNFKIGFIFICLMVSCLITVNGEMNRRVKRGHILPFALSQYSAERFGPFGFKGCLHGLPPCFSPFYPSIYSSIYGPFFKK